MNSPSASEAAELDASTIPPFSSRRINFTRESDLASRCSRAYTALSGEQSSAMHHSQSLYVCDRTDLMHSSSAHIGGL